MKGFRRNTRNEGNKGRKEGIKNGNNEKEKRKAVRNSMYQKERKVLNAKEGVKYVCLFNWMARNHLIML